ncbi:serine hydrolase domain-containing protein [Pseudoalteromonas ardens]|uniref:serine hydrolase domain-containing protein n=1 Tax=Pseudoalteromonas ardens TaxID=3048490 RepID=UPI0024C46A88|nr:serine hydrolase domain-containing protein [Pseudoalteromonas sp. R96]MDK1311304.1 serine hydrolase domain-containing protein [Pseudoalteromonas sp. R96]
MLRSLIILATLLLSNLTYAETKQNKIQTLLDAQALSGITWGMVTQAQVTTGSAGYANIEHSQKMLHNQKMHVGSVTKTVLSLGVLRLISQGKLTLETPVQPLLPNLHFNNPWETRAPVRVKHLLTHTAGLDNIRMWQFLSTTPTPVTPLAQAFPTENKALLKIRTEPGTQYSYSNMGYTLLGMVIEAVTDQRYEAYLDQHLLIPLGMHDSTFEFTSQSANTTLAMGYHENQVAQSAVPVYTRPAGQFTTTASDMATFIQFVLSDGVLNGEAIVDPELMDKLFDYHITNADKAGLEIGRGLAFANRDRYGVIGHCHPGTTFGFRANICVFPEQKKGYFYAINTDSESADYEAFKALFVELLELNETKIAQPGTSTKDMSAWLGVYELSPNNMAEFEFLDKLFGLVWVSASGEQITLHSLQSAPRILHHIEGGLYRDSERTQASHVFFTNQAGELILSNGLKTFKKANAVEISLYWASLLLGLCGFLYILIFALFRLVTKRFTSFRRLQWGLMNLLAFSVPILLYLNQSFLAFGDVTLASISLTTLTALLPFSLICSLWQCYQQGIKTKGSMRDGILLIMALQLCAVLAAWGHLPALFWR